MGSMKSQLKKADSSGAAFALIFGQEELSKGTLIVKSLRDGVGAQQVESLKDVDRWGKALQSQILSAG
jgi:histidyl-tRNA synthetase